MDKQTTISAFRNELALVRTKKEEFLSQVERIVLWKEWLAMVQPCYYKGERGLILFFPDGPGMIIGCRGMIISLSDLVPMGSWKAMSPSS